MSNHELVRERFGANAMAYKMSKVHSRGASLARLVELVEPQADWRVLDVATGAGHTAMVFAPHVAEVVASDLTPEMLVVAEGLAREQGVTNMRFELVDAEAMGFAEGVFDVVVCRIAPHHFPRVERFVGEAVRVLKEGGLLAVVDNVVPDDVPAGDFVNAFEKYRDPSHFRCLSAIEWQALFEQAGLTVRQVEMAQKTMDFGKWTATQKVSEEDKGVLWEMMVGAPAGAIDFLAPEYTNGNFTFQLTEGLFVGQKR